jgi:hypothetical protein
MTDEQKQAQAHPPAWSTIFDHADPPIFDDGPSYDPPKDSTAAKHAAGVRQREQKAAQDRARLAEHFRKQREAAERDPLRGVPTSEILAARYRLRDDSSAA